MNLARYTIYREYFNEATKGHLYDSTCIKLCETLERPNLNNAKDNPKTINNESSCIPEGIYLVNWTRSNFFSNKKKSKIEKANLIWNEEKDSVWTFELMKVKDREGIRIHTANNINQLLGCIAPCMQIIDMNPRETEAVKPENRWYASQSGIALAKLQKLLPKKFELEITHRSDK